MPLREYDKCLYLSLSQAIQYTRLFVYNSILVQTCERVCCIWSTWIHLAVQHHCLLSHGSSIQSNTISIYMYNRIGCLHVCQVPVISQINLPHLDIFFFLPQFLHKCTWKFSTNAIKKYRDHILNDPINLTTNLNAFSGSNF